MAKFKYELPTETIKEIEYLYSNCEDIFGKMTKAGAEVAHKNIMANMPRGFQTSEIKNNLKVTTTYRTAYDNGINTKVAFYGYFENEKGEVVPAPLVANAFEYGTRDRISIKGYRGSITKQPFLRKSFSKRAIIVAMEQAQEELSKGILK